MAKPKRFIEGIPILILSLLYLAGCATYYSSSYLPSSGRMSLYQKDPLSLLGKARDSEEFREVVTYLSPNPEVDVVSSSLYFTFRNDSVQFMFDQREILQEIWFFSSGNFYEDQFPFQYSGKLPFNLSFSDSKQKIVDNLGVPTESFNDGWYEVWRYGYQGSRGGGSIFFAKSNRIVAFAVSN